MFYVILNPRYFAMRVNVYYCTHVCTFHAAALARNNVCIHQYSTLHMLIRTTYSPSNKTEGIIEKRVVLLHRATFIRIHHDQLLSHMAASRTT